MNNTVEVTFEAGELAQNPTASTSLHPVAQVLSIVFGALQEIEQAHLPNSSNHTFTRGVTQKSFVDLSQDFLCRTITKFPGIATMSTCRISFGHTAEVTGLGIEDVDVTFLDRDHPENAVHGCLQFAMPVAPGSPKVGLYLRNFNGSGWMHLAPLTGTEELAFVRRLRLMQSYWADDIHAYNERDNVYVDDTMVGADFLGAFAPVVNPERFAAFLKSTDGHQPVHACDMNPDIFKNKPQTVIDGVCVMYKPKR